MYALLLNQLRGPVASPVEGGVSLLSRLNLRFQPLVPKDKAGVWRSCRDLFCYPIQASLHIAERIFVRDKFHPALFLASLAVTESIVRCLRRRASS